MSGLTRGGTAGRDGRTRLARPNSQARTGTGKLSFFPVQLTTSRTGKPYLVDAYSAESAVQNIHRLIHLYYRDYPYIPRQDDF